MLTFVVYETEIDIDALLKKDLLTLDEAMKTANDAVLLAIKAISVLKSVKFHFQVFLLLFVCVKVSYG